MMNPETSQKLRLRLANLLAEDEVSPLRRAYREAAAVLVSFDLRTLQPVGHRADPAEAAAFSEDCEPVHGEGGWTLRRHLRRETLRSLAAEPGRLRAARQANDGPRTPLQLHLDAALGLASRPSSRNENRLPALRVDLTVADWLEGIVSSVRPVARIREEIARLQLLEPFRELVGDHFGGRQQELAELSDYVGVFAASKFSESFSRGVEWILDLHERPPLFVHGPGGIGKSTLIAKFILDHARAADEAHRFPYAYLDFDRTALNPQEPLTLLLEALRQISVQYSAEFTERGRRLEAEWRDRMAKLDSVRRGGDGVAGTFRLANRDYYLDTFAEFIASLPYNNQPLLLVLDTFEEVQYRAASHVTEVFHLLSQLQQRVPRTRAVISGRDLPKVFLGNSRLRLRELPLGEFDETAAAAFLQNRGVSPLSTARLIVKQVGRSPLALRVAADLWKTEGNKQGITELEYTFLDRLRGKRIEAVLYTRILSHLKDERVRKLAHPGLVLRKVNAELILEALAGPCQVEVKTLADAQTLFEVLRQEFTLVTPDPSDPATVVHRPDVRTLMLGALRDAEPDKVREIHRRAAAYYSGRHTEADQAEEYYHRLAQGVDRERMEQPDFPRLDLLLPVSALLELPPASQAFLASRLAIDVSEEVWDEADPRDWERWAMRRIREAQATGSSDGLKFLDSPPKRAPRDMVRRLRGLTSQDAGRSLAAARLADGLGALERETLRQIVVDAGWAKPILQLQDSEVMPAVLTQRALSEGWLDDLAAAALAARPNDRSIYAAAQELGLTSLTGDTLREMQATTPPWDLNLVRERLGVIERQVCLVKMGKSHATGFLIGPGYVLLPQAPLAELELVFDYKRPAKRSRRLAGSEFKLVAASGRLGMMVLHADHLAQRGAIPIGLDAPPAGSPILCPHHPNGDLLTTILANPGAWGAPCLDQSLRAFAATRPNGAAVPVREILHWLAEAKPEAAAWCSPEFGLRLMTDVALEPRPEVRAAMGQVLGQLGMDTRKGVGVTADGVPDIDWVRIPEGSFVYQDGDWRNARLETFCMARYQVTNTQFEAFLNAQDGYTDDRWWAGLANPDRRSQSPRWSEPNHPRETVSWYEAMAFCSWLSHRLGFEVRLPTEKEWERAARGTDGREYPWGNGYKAGFANINEKHGKVGPDYLQRTSAVGIYPQGASVEGVMDLAGNVWEWCLNEYANPKRTQRSGTDPRALRGGSWSFDRVDARAAFRLVFHPFGRFVGIGFRVVSSSPIR